MRLHYFPETDSLYIDLVNRPGVECRKVVEGIMLDFDAEGNLIGIDIDHASKLVNLTELESIDLPFSSVSLKTA